MWNGRLAVWACEHLWRQADAGDHGARAVIAEAAELFTTDSDENVAICEECALHDQAVLMGRRWVNTVFGSGNEGSSLIDVSLTKDGLPMENYPLPAELFEQ